MAKYLLQKGDIVRLELGKTIFAPVPQRFIYTETPFSTKMCDNTQISIGKIYRKHSISHEDLAVLSLEAVSSILHLSKNLINEASKEKMVDFIKSLPLNFDEEVFDTSIYVGKYIVDYSYSDDGNSWHVFCKKLDNPSVKINFFQEVTFAGTTFVRK